MSIRWFRTFAAIAVMMPLVSQQSVMAVELDQPTFQRLHAELEPSPDETWRTIPWKIDLLDAQKAAATEGKPIFIWAMDGHPLGCT